MLGIISEKVYEVSVYAFLAGAFVVFFVLTGAKIRVPYGRFTSNSWGRVAINSKVGWMLMESFAPLFFCFCLVQNALNSKLTTMQIAFFCVWQFHYAYRAFVYPLFTSHSKRTPLLMILSGVCFQVINTLFQTFWIFNLGAANYPDSYLISFPCIAGIFLFITGTVINRHSDFILRGLRKNGDYSYKIPRGGLFFLVSCPNYLGEILIWLGWAIMLNAPAGFCFFAWTVANLLPRAISSHLWYREHFQDYPPGRKALIPFLL